MYWETRIVGSERQEGKGFITATKVRDKFLKDMMKTVPSFN